MIAGMMLVLHFAQSVIVILVNTMPKFLTLRDLTVFLFTQSSRRIYLYFVEL